jgi:hypothetical protein
VVEDQFRIAFVQAVEFAAERPALCPQERAHGLVGGVGRGEDLVGARGGQRRAEQVPADATAAARGIDHEEIGEVAAEEVGRLDDGEPGDRAMVEIDQALPEIHAAPEEVGPALVCLGGAMFDAQDAVSVTGHRATYLALPLGHRPSLAYQTGAMPGTRAGVTVSGRSGIRCSSGPGWCRPGRLSGAVGAGRQPTRPRIWPTGSNWISCRPGDRSQGGCGWRDRPVVAIVLGVVVLGETVTAAARAGIALVLAGVALTRRRGKAAVGEQAQ